MIEDPVVIIGASRTPLGGFGGDLAPVSAPELGAVAISDAIRKSGIVVSKTTAGGYRGSLYAHTRGNHRMNEVNIDYDSASISAAAGH